MPIRSVNLFVYCEAYNVRNISNFVKNNDTGRDDNVWKVYAASLLKVEVNVHEDLTRTLGTSARSGIGKLNQGLHS
jgi:hypothetical protein